MPELHRQVDHALCAGALGGQVALVARDVGQLQVQLGAELGVFQNGGDLDRLAHGRAGGIGIACGSLCSSAADRMRPSDELEGVPEQAFEARMERVEVLRALPLRGEALVAVRDACAEMHGALLEADIHRHQIVVWIDLGGHYSKFVDDLRASGGWVAPVLAHRDYLKLVGLRPRTIDLWIREQADRQATLADWNKAAFDAKSMADTLKALGAGTPAESKDVQVTGPDIAENGAVVPVGVTSSLAGTTMLAILIDKNPNALAASFTLPAGTEANVQTRVKMGQTSTVYALVKADGKFYMATKEIKVTLGGCGG